MGEQLELGFIDLLAADPAYFKSIIPILQTNPQLPSPAFCGAQNLNLSYSELTKVLADIQVGPQATPPGSPPSQVAQLTLQDEAGMLGLLDDRSFSGGILDPALFAASEQVLASVFFTETADAYTALSNLDYSEHSNAGHSPGHDDGKELILWCQRNFFFQLAYTPCNRQLPSISSSLPRISLPSRVIWFLTRLPRIRT